jgi:hypothetical protein
MKTIVRTIVFLFLVIAPFSPGFAAPIESVVTVGTIPLWTDSGIILNSAKDYVISNATGTVSWADWSGRFSGPNGDSQPTLTWDEWITNGQHGQLIGFVGDNPYPTSQNDSALFAIGTGTVTLSGKSGKLWLGFNDDFTHPTEWDDDNLGSMTVKLAEGNDFREVVPEPATLFLIGSGLLGILGLGRKL